MDIAKLGVAIDPTKAVEGARKAKSAMREIGDAAKTELSKVDKAAERAGVSTRKIGEDAKRGFGEMSRGIVDMLDAVGMMDSGFGAFVRRAMALNSSLASPHAAYMALRNGGRDAAEGMAASANATASVSTAVTAAATATSGASAIVTSSAAKMASAVGSSAAASTAQAASARTAATANGVYAASQASVAAASTAMVASSTAATASTTAMGLAGMTAASRMRILNGIIALCRGSLENLNRLRLGGPGGSKVIDIDAEVVSNVKRLTIGMNEASGAGGKLPPVLRSVNAAGSAAGGGMAVAGSGLMSFVAIAGGAIAIITALIAALTALGISLSLLKQGMELAGPVQKTEQSIRTMTGSAKEAKRVLDELRATSRATGGDLGGSMDTVKRFLALGFSTDDALKLNKSILDVAGSIGMSAEEAKLLGMALAQVQAKGIVSMEELRQQIAEKGVPVIDELAKKMGVTTAALIKMVEDGKVRSKELIDLFLNMEGGFAKFAGGAQKMTETMPGALARLKAVWEDVLRTAGEPVNTALVPLVNQLADFLDTLRPLAKEIGDNVAMAIRALMAAFENGQIGDLFGKLLMAGVEWCASQAITNFQLSWIAIAKLLGMALTNAVQSVVNVLATALTAVIDFIAKLIEGDWKGAFGMVAKFFGDLFTGGGIVSNIGKTIYNVLGKAFEDVVNIFYQAFMKVWQSVANAISKGLVQFGKEPLAPVSIPGRVSFFKPEEVNYGDLKASSDKLVGTGARDELAAYLKQLGVNPEKMPGEDNYKPPVRQDVPLPEDKKTGKEKIPKAREVEFLDTQTQKLIKDWTDLDKQIDGVIAGVAQSMASNLTDGLTGLINGTKDLKTAFSDMATSIINDIIRMVIQMYIQLAVAQMLAAMGYGGTGGAGYSVGGNTYAGSPGAHTGGVSGGRKLISYGIPTYHTGGVSTAEAMTKVERGETILTRRRAEELEAELNRRQDRGRSNQGGGQKVQILNVTDSRQVLDVIASNPDVIVNAISKRQPAVRDIVQRKERK